MLRVVEDGEVVVNFDDAITVIPSDAQLLAADVIDQRLTPRRAGARHPRRQDQRQ